MRIGIDVRYLSHGLVGGVHNYVKNFVPALIELAADHEIYLYADTKAPFELQNLPAHVTARYLPYNNMASSIYHDFFMRGQMLQDQIEVAHFPANYGFGPRPARTVITLHDAINIHPLGQILNGLASSNSRTPRNVVMMTYLHFCTERALRRADMLLTVSEYSKCEIAHYSDFESDRIVPIFHGQAPDLHKIEDNDKLAEVRRKFELTRPFVLADALKNPIVLVKAWRRLPADVRDRFQIVFFSRRPDPLPIVHEAQAAGEARLLIRPERDDLIALFSMAEAFVFPSWIEGFGLPLLEAMTCGAPIIASDRGSIPEVAGDAAIITDAEDDRAMAEHLQCVLGDPAEAARLRAKGFARVAQFTWQNTARQILSAYEQVLAQPLLEVQR